MASETSLTAQVGDTITALKRYRGLSDDQVAARIGWKRGRFVNKRLGLSAVSVEDLEQIAVALNVEAPVLLMGEREALRWVLDHAPDLHGGAAQSICTHAPWDRELYGEGWWPVPHSYDQPLPLELAA